MTIKPAISMRDVRFAYKPASLILGIDELTILPGHRIFLHGPSVSGKTTLLSLISSVLVPQRGSITVLGQELTRLSASARDRLRGSQIGYIFQGFNLIRTPLSWRISSCRAIFTPRAAPASPSRRCRKRWLASPVTLTFTPN
jgi:predicted ABC-type transport system involved in lysophospholipase L1 biosynthesis ATPase subunit